jgi:hypothetical protein
VTVSADNVPARLRAILRSDEQVIAFAWAQVPRRRTGYLTDATTAAIVDAVDLVRGFFAARRLRERSVAFGFPLDRHMAMIVTNDRLVVWSTSRWTLRAPVHLSDLPRSRILSARLPYVGGGWRVVEVSLVGGRGVRFLADGRNAESLVKALS